MTQFYLLNSHLFLSIYPQTQKGQNVSLAFEFSFLSHCVWVILKDKLKKGYNTLSSPVFV